VSTRTCDYRLQIGFGGGIGGRFTFGTSLIGDSDIFVTDWTEFFDGPFDDVTDYVADGTTVNLSRGLDQKAAVIESGKLSFSLIKPDDISFFDPNDPDSPLNDGTVAPGFEPMRPVRLEASNDGWLTSKGLFYGTIRTPNYDPDSGICSLRCEDFFYWMGRVKNPIIPTVAGVTSSEAAGMLLDAFGFTDPAFRSLSANPALTDISFGADGSKTLLELLKGLLDAEQGRCYFDGDGVFHWEDRYARDRRSTPSVAFSTELIAVSSRADADAINNRASVTGTNGITQTSEDEMSVHDFGVGDAASIVTDYIVDGQDLADLVLMRVKDPHPPQQTTIDNESDSIMSAQLDLELNDRIQVSDTDVYIERLSHAIDAGGVHHSTTLIVTEAPDFPPFMFGISEIVDPAATVGDYISA
jgi:hypothetical protein